MQPSDQVERGEAGVLVAHLADGDEAGLDAVRAAFTRANPGYDLQYRQRVRRVEPSSGFRIAFIQESNGDDLTDPSDGVAVGDVVVLRPGDALDSERDLSLLLFTVPAPVPDAVPRHISPDWDPGITDVPGGCATEEGAYRRILLTWLESNGPYVYHGLNAHRVRITDSFTHYHPKQGGFDEFYLVQMSNDRSRLLTSLKVDRIEQPSTIEQAEAERLFDSLDLEVGDLVYLPRGTAHRGLGGVLAQVITVPGFRPGPRSVSITICAP